MKRFYLLLTMLLLVFTAVCQEGKGYVHLQNGSIIKGKYVFSNDDYKIHIHSGKNIWIFDKSEVLKIEKNRSNINFSDSIVKSKRIHYRIEFGILSGSAENSQSAPFSFSGTVNYRIGKNLSLGLGSGIDYLKETHLPIFGNVEYNLGHSQTHPFLFLKAGYLIPLEESNELYHESPHVWDYNMNSYWPGMYSLTSLDANSGFMGNVGAGFQHYFSNNFGMSLSVGYQFYRLSYSGENSYQLNIDHNRMSIRVGFLF